jgi:hypothetical protein
MDDAIHNLIQPCIAKHWRQDGPCVELVGLGLDEIPRVTRPRQRFLFPYSKFSTIQKQILHNYYANGNHLDGERDQSPIHM